MAPLSDSFRPIVLEKDKAAKTKKVEEGKKKQAERDRQARQKRDGADVRPGKRDDGGKGAERRSA